MMRYSVAMTAQLHEQAASHLLAEAAQEDLTFALYRPSQGASRHGGLINQLVLPGSDERDRHGNVSFHPAYFERALAAAREAEAGLVLMHSHVGPGWQGMSPDDVAAELRLAPAALGATGLPLLGLTIGTDEAWSARFWIKTAPREYARAWCESVRVVGERLRVTYADHLLPPPVAGPELERTVSAWGDAAQADLARLRIGIVGTGSVGFLVGAALAHTAIKHVKLIDFDGVETRNRDRLLYVCRDDVGRAKVAVLAEALREASTADGFIVEAHEWSIVEPEGFLEALDCDVLFSCVDRPLPRAILNLIAYAHLIPVIDGGIIAEPAKRGLRRADWRSHVVGPGHKCLECLGQYDASLVSADREGYLDDPAYIQGLPADHPVRRKENVFAFSMATAAAEVGHLITLTTVSPDLGSPGAQKYHLVPGCLTADPGGCMPTCFYQDQIALGDHTIIKPTGRHRVAEEARAARRPAGRGSAHADR